MSGPMPKDFENSLKIVDPKLGPVEIHSNGERVWLHTNGKTAVVNSVVMSFTVYLAFDKTRREWSQHCRREDGSTEWMRPSFNRVEWDKEVSEAGRTKVVELCKDIVARHVEPKWLGLCKLEALKKVFQRTDGEIHEAEKKLEALREQREAEAAQYLHFGESIGIYSNELNEVIRAPVGVED